MSTGGEEKSEPVINNGDVQESESSTTTPQDLGDTKDDPKDVMGAEEDVAARLRMKAHVLLAKVENAEASRSTPVGTPGQSSGDLRKLEQDSFDEEAANAAITAAAKKAEELAELAAATVAAAEKGDEDDAAAVAEAKQKKEQDIANKK